MNPALVPTLFGLAGQLLTETSEIRARAHTGKALGIPRRARVSTGARARARGIPRRALTGALGNNLPGQEFLQCHGVDVDKFREDCRVPIYRDMWNIWKLQRSTADGKGPQELEHATEAFINLISQSLEGKIRHLELRIGGSENPWKTPAHLHRETICGHPMSLMESEYSPQSYDVFVRFVYRGVETHIPWVAFKKNLTVFGVDCPLDATWLLDTVYTPSQVLVPAASTDSPFGTILDPKNKLDGNYELSFGEKAALYGTLGLLAAVAVGYAVRSVR
jgi:hypothetical protein